MEVKIIMSILCLAACLVFAVLWAAFGKDPTPWLAASFVITSMDYKK